jgi:predicted KAP-like P-loop ATPase
MWSDNETVNDFLCCQHIVQVVEELVANEQLLPCSVGIFGDWGSGKTSLLRMVESKLNQRTDTVVIWFNGWQHEGMEDAKTAIMGTILEQLASRKSLSEKGLGLLCSLWKRVDKMRVALLFGKVGAVAAGTFLASTGHSGHEIVTAGAASSAVIDIGDLTTQIKEACGDSVKVEDVSKCLKDSKDAGFRKDVREFRNDFSKLLKSDESIKSVVIFIDDLDRCMPETIIETLEAIKLFLFAPKTAFIIGADERLVKYAVRKRFPELAGEKSEVGRDYLEKLIQFPVRVPSLGVGELETYINLLFANLGWLSQEQFSKLLKSVSDVQGSDVLDTRLTLVSAKKVLGDKLHKSLEESFVLTSHIAPLLAVGLAGNPRQCKRFLNTLIMRQSMAKHAP